jgi:outer membrane lipoprotein-sorting protein/peroxiredoxin
MSGVRVGWLGGLAVLAATLAGGGPARTDEAADALLGQMRAALARVKTLQADLEVTAGEQKYAGSVALQRPNLARVELKGYATELVVSDGKKLFSYMPRQNQYREDDAAADGANINLSSLPSLRGFFTPAANPTVPAGATATVAKETLDGTPYDVITVQGKPQELRLNAPAAAGQPAQPRTVALTITNRYYVGADRLVHRLVTSTRIGDRDTPRTITLKNVRVDAPVAAGLFAWAPPATATKFTPPPAAPRPDYLAELVPVGKAVPDFDLPMPGGQRLALHAALKQNKATLLTFWFRGCPPCRAEHPHLQKLFTDLKAKGFDVIAINRGDSEAVITEYFNENSYTFRTVMGGSGDQYTVGRAFGVRAYPTNYLVGADGKVLWRGVGYSEKALADLQAAITAAGIQ